MHGPESPLHVQHQRAQDTGSDGAHSEMVFEHLDCRGSSKPGSKHPFTDYINHFKWAEFQSVRFGPMGLHDGYG